MTDPKLVEALAEWVCPAVQGGGVPCDGCRMKAERFADTHRLVQLPKSNVQTKHAGGGMSYEPKIEVVREIWSQYGASEWGTGRDGPGERAYLVRGLPMPGERVLNGAGKPRTVWRLELDDDRICVRYVEGGWDPLSMVTPYDPDAERLKVATEAVRKVNTPDGFATNEAIARAVLEALKKVEK